MDDSNSPGAGLAKPLMVYDGDCHFCRRWIARWNEITTDQVDYRPLQAAAADFPHIPREEFEREVKLIEPDGRVLGGASAVFQVLAEANGAAIYRLARWLYVNLAIFRAATGSAYRFVARHRTVFSTRDTLALGRGCPRANVFYRADVVSARAGAGILLRVPLVARAGGWPDRQGRHPALPAVAGRRADAGGHAGRVPIIFPPSVG